MTFLHQKKQTGKLAYSNILAVINKNKQVFQPNSNLIDTLLTEKFVQDQGKLFYNESTT